MFVYDMHLHASFLDELSATVLADEGLVPGMLAHVPQHVAGEDGAVVAEQTLVPEPTTRILFGLLVFGPHTEFEMFYQMLVERPLG